MYFLDDLHVKRKSLESGVIHLSRGYIVIRFLYKAYNVVHSNCKDVGRRVPLRSF
jgi:hypothetical protein